MSHFDKSLVAVAFAAAGAVVTGCGARAPSITRASFAFPVDTLETAKVGKGVTERFIYSRMGPWAINVLDVQLARCLTAVAVKGAPSAVGRLKTSEILRGLERERDVVGGVNADFFSLQNG